MAGSRLSVRRLRRTAPRTYRILQVIVFGLFRQRDLVFRPSRGDVGSPKDVGLEFEELHLDGGRQGRLRAWWVPGAEPAGKAVLFFPGRRGNISYDLQTLRFLRRCGVSVLAADYPGYGASEGSPSEEGCHATGRAVAAALAERGFARGDTILYGRSMGGAVAARLAAAEPHGGLVLHGGFTSLPDLARHHLPTWSAALCRITLDAGVGVDGAHCPLLFLHSRRDSLVPPAVARNLFERAPGPRRWLEVEGGHYSSDWLFDTRVREGWNELVSGAAEGWERAA